MTDQRTRVAVTDHVAVVTLARPDKHNALDAAMFEAIAGAAADVAATPGVRAVVLHGEGPSFCSGLDVGSFLEAGDGVAGFDVLLDRAGPRSSNLAQRVATDWLDLPVPVIAAVHGNCFGGGLQIALGADIRIAAPDARLSVMEVRWGLVPDMAITQTLPRLVGLDVAKELTFTGRRVTGEEAAALGLVTRVADDPLAAARELAAEIASRSPDAVRAAKRLYEETWPAPAAQALELETELQRGLMGSPNQLAAVVAGMSGEPAQFADPA
jgi:enoyl-CoA hydratase/carnithine racemase